MTHVVCKATTPVRADPELGIPYTWGEGRFWYVRIGFNSTIILNSANNGISSVGGTRHTINLEGFRYATEMEIK
ncbi:hypothetical protein fHeYen301_13 [Yersinia phage fHe-Yen3-01]|uniref:Uncharacterized protein n=1 Tax=Yersinia phage fHe-Yen3-01 TaxID=1932893 RepID=A0A1L7DQG9_9CAUD|nr:hypothetical protein HOR56_gp13 [Yersinia phage fHe-Yen3-01]APU00346.1 hypothetical protein fHeYen301_13 [Yersinia phage fHe-Yen3-01]